MLNVNAHGRHPTTAPERDQGTATCTGTGGAAECCGAQDRVRKAIPEVKAIYGDGFEPKKYLSEVTDWMRAQGVPEGVFGQITKGYELKAITKAMLYDKMQEARKAAAKKLAESPKVQPPKGRPSGDNGSADRVRTARALLHKTPTAPTQSSLCLKPKPKGGHHGKSKRSAQGREHQR